MWDRIKTQAELDSRTRTQALGLSLCLSDVFLFPNVILKQVSFCEISVGTAGSVLVA